ncbi:hypothetical protein [Clostridium neonatale]|uniref:hypothetical protein n=1 Tax=Clostridium neonatale TaxID=137838 RepID=UPI00291C4A78|nr:hypothetical protein [Clostridium neonatale]CAI3193117.1 hypothetical protein CNEO2_130124 [Clostridium neonatale]CAI3196955.1 hypothetical protein CNEO2_160017 [Clostridium neonatale]
MRVKVLQNFNDGKKNCLCITGQIIEVTKKRYEEINSTSNGPLVEEIKEEKKNDSEDEKIEEEELGEDEKIEEEE